MWLVFQLSLLLPIIINALPHHHLRKHAAIAASVDAAPLFSLDGGNVGVNFGGYHASAGLGGLLTGNAADGGLHAEAGTPYGQTAGAGLGGTVGGDGNAVGYRFAYADKGPNPFNLFGLLGTFGTSTELVEVETVTQNNVETLE